MDDLQKAAENAVRVCAGVKPGERVLIITDEKTRYVAEVIRDEAGKITDNVDYILLEEFGKRPLKKLPKRLRDSILKSDAIFFAANSVEGELYPLRRSIRDLAQRSGRYAHMPNINREIMEGIRVDNVRIQEMTQRVYEIVNGCRKIRVKGSNGTNIVAEFGEEFLWVKLGSIIGKGEWTNLPGAEVMTYPRNVNGTYIVDGVLGDHFVKYGDLQKTPVRIEIRDGVAVSVECENKGIEQELDKYLDQDRNGRRVGEFALGTNIFLKDFIGVLLQDEKFPTVHIALGNPYPDMTKAKYDAKTHIDAVTRDVSVWVDGRKIMEKGKYVLEDRKIV